MKTSPKKTELYLWDKQKSNEYSTGFEVETHLKETGLIERCLSLEDEIVKEWIKNPKTYPEEYKKVYPYLWKSTGGRRGFRRVACLDWYDARVVVNWHWLDSWWYGSDPALLASSSEPLKVKKVREIPETIEYKGIIYKRV